MTALAFSPNSKQSRMMTSEKVKVTGYASTEAIDAAGEIFTSSAIRDALPDFFRGGHRRDAWNHDMVAAGVVIEAEIDSKGRTSIVAKVVDFPRGQESSRGCFKGFSGRGKDPGPRLQRTAG